MLLVNIFPDIMLHAEDAANGTGGLLYYFYMLDEWSILPSLIFLGVGAMTDFGPLIANPKSFLLGAAAQFGIFATYLGAMAMGFSDKAAAAISIIGGADGPTSIFLAGKDLNRISVQKCLRTGGGAYGSTKQNNYDIHQGV